MQIAQMLFANIQECNNENTEPNKEVSIIFLTI